MRDTPRRNHQEDRPGQMETSFHYDLSQKALSFKLKEKISAPPGVEIKGRGLFNTVTGQLGYIGTVRATKNIGHEAVNVGNTPLKLSAGVFFEGADTKSVPKPLLHFRAKKAISLLDGPRTVASAKAWGNLDPQTAKATTRRATLKLSHKWLGFTRKQDLKIAGGFDLDWPSSSRSATVAPFIQVRENNWAVNYRRNGWYVTYDL